MRIQKTMLNIPKVKETMAVFLFRMEKKTQTEMSPEMGRNILFISRQRQTEVS